MLKEMITRQDLLFALRLRYVSQQEAEQIGGGHPVEIPTLGELAKQFLGRSEVECRPRVHQTNKARVQHVLDFFGDDLPVNMIATEHIEEYRRCRLEMPARKNSPRKVTPSTVNKEIIKLGQLLDIAVERKAIEDNPARKLKPLRDEGQRIPRALSGDEIKRLSKTAQEQKELFKGWAYEVVLTYLYTGMRRNELLWLEWEDVDLPKRRLTVREKEEWTPKPGGKGVVGIARRLREEVFSKLPREGRFVFGGERPLMSGESATRAFRKLVKKAKLPVSISLHSLRHTYITHLLEQGTSLRRVQDRAGHGEITTTWKYSHALPSDEVIEDRLDF